MIGVSGWRTEHLMKLLGCASSMAFHYLVTTTEEKGFVEGVLRNCRTPGEQTVTRWLDRCPCWLCRNAPSTSKALRRDIRVAGSIGHQQRLSRNDRGVGNRRQNRRGVDRERTTRQRRNGQLHLVRVGFENFPVKRNQSGEFNFDIGDFRVNRCAHSVVLDQIRQFASEGLKLRSNGRNSLRGGNVTRIGRPCVV